MTLIRSDGTDILEFIVECAMFYVGIPMGYGSIKTLTDTNMRNSIGDIRAFKPTIMVGVPAVWELIRKGIATKVQKGGAVKAKLFAGAMMAKQAAPGILGPIADAVVFNKVKQATGGRLKYALSGGAAISTDTQEFLMTCLTTLIQGYGASERVSQRA
jgi:long-chain acyl-CoA synthetase